MDSSERKAERREGRKAASMEAKDWIAAGLDALAKEGVSGLQVETLARKIGITKGSFYWHFKDRNDFHQAILESWSEETLPNVIAPPSENMGPLERLKKLVGLPFGAPLTRLSTLESAVRVWGLQDRRARSAIRALDNLRIQQITRMFEDRGLEPLEARGRAIITYSYIRMSRVLLDRDDLDTIAVCERLVLESCPDD